MLGYKINLDKSELLAINISKRDRRELETQFPAKWKTSSIQHLGVKFSAKLQDMVKDNVEHLWHQLKKKLEIWTSLPLSWCGRISVIKMNVLIFIYDLKLVYSPKADQQDGQSTINKFIWNHRPFQGLKLTLCKGR